MRKKGFTLIELLAVIVILSVIALITIPIIINLVSNARKEAFRDSVYAVNEAALNYIANEEINGREINWRTNSITGERYITFNLGNEEDTNKLNIKGKAPKKGNVEITKNGLTNIVAIDGNLCALKNYNENLVNLLSLNENSICLLTNSNDGLTSEETSDIISTVKTLTNKVEQLENDRDALNEKIAEINNDNKTSFLKAHPVGSIYITTNSDESDVGKMKEKFGGTWEVFAEGRTLKSSTSDIGEVGGSSTVSLTEANLPSHKHTYTPSGTVSKPTFTGSAVNSGNQSANHTHSYTAPATSTGSTAITNAQLPKIGTNIQFHSAGGVHTNVAGVGAVSGYTNIGSAATTYSKYMNIGSISSGSASAKSYDNIRILIGGGQGHTHSITNSSANTGTISANHYHSVTAAGTVSTPTFTGTTADTSSVGSETAFSVLDPYINVYMYKRTS